MRTLTRSLIAVGTAGAVFAASFAITSALRPDAPSVDDPIAVPGYSTEQARLLTPVTTDEGGADAAEIDLSSLAGSMAVTVPDELPAEATAPPEVIAAAAALDAAGGDPARLVPATEEGDTPAAPSDEERDPASDPCAPTDASPDPSCPEGLTATLFSLMPGEDLTVYATADPVTGPGLGSSIYCDPTDVPEGVLRLGGLTNDSATVTIVYWPEDDPATTTSVTLTQVATYVEGSARHCGQTEPLAEGTYEAQAFAINADGVIASPWSFRFDSRGKPTTPEMRTLALGPNWLWVGVYHGALETAEIRAFPLTEGGDASCEAVRAPGSPALRKDIADHTSVVPASWLESHNYNAAYTRVTSALLYLPEGTSGGICGLTFSGGEPSWDANVPERIQYATAAAPDSWEAVLTLRSVAVYRPGSVQLQALTHMGYYCGSGYSETFDIEASDTATVVDVGQELCRIGGQNVQLDVQTFFTPDAGGSGRDESRARVGILGATCTGDCPAPEPRTYTVFLPGLGQDMCPDSAEDDCDLRRRTAGARAVIDVTWESGGEGTREEWGVSAAADLPPSDEVRPDTARFDLLSTLTPRLSADGFSADATSTLRWDRAVTFSAQLIGTCFEGSTAAPPPVTGRATPASAGVFQAIVTFRNLCPGHTYGLAVTYTDEAGHTQLAAPEGEHGLTPDVVWSTGWAAVPQLFLDATARIEVSRNDRVEASYLVRDSFLEINYGRLAPSFGPFLNDRCFSGASTVSASDTDPVELARSYDVTPVLNVVSDWYYYPRSATCGWRASSFWVPATNATVTLEQLLAGTEIRGTMVPRDFPDAEESTVPFTYRIVLTAEYATDD